MFTIFAGVYYWFPKMTGPDVQREARQAALLADVRQLQRDVLPDALGRAARDAAARLRLRRAFGDLNLFISIASFVLGASIVVFFYNMITSWVRGPSPRRTRGARSTIEWQISSPPPVFNFDEIPQVVGGPYEYGVPGARHAVFGARDSQRRRKCTRDRAAVSVLVVANETLAGRELIDALERRAAHGPDPRASSPR